MSFLVVLFVLGLRQFSKAAEPAAMVAVLMRRWRDSWLERATQEGWGRRAALVFVVLPPVLLILALALASAGVWHGLWSAVVSLVVMLLVLLDRTQPDVLAREQAAWQQADENFQEILRNAESDTVYQAASNEFVRARQSLLAEQLRELFAPLFWFLLLGPVAAIAYYFLRVAAERIELAENGAEQLLYYANWPVVRLLGLSFALAGDFTTAWQRWREQIFRKEMPAIEFLDGCAAEAQIVKLVEPGETKPGAVLSIALQTVAALLHRTLIIWIVILALHTLWP